MKSLSAHILEKLSINKNYKDVKWSSQITAPFGGTKGELTLRRTEEMIQKANLGKLSSWLGIWPSSQVTLGQPLKALPIKSENAKLQPLAKWN